MSTRRRTVAAALLAAALVHLAATVAVVVAAVVATPAAAVTPAPSLTISQSSGSPGDERTLTGAGWCAKGDLAVGMARAGSRDTPATLFTTTPTTDTFSRSFAVPQLSTGPYTITAVQSCRGERAPRLAQVDFTITTTYVLQVDPASARPGTSVLVTGENWDSAAGPVSVFLRATEASDPTKALSISTVQAGRFRASFATPDEPPAGYRLYACQLCGQTQGRPSQTASFTILRPRQVAPVLSLAPASGLAGDAVVASGSNWSDGDGQVSVFANAADVTHPERALGRVAPARGQFELGLTVPVRASTGTHAFVACQRCGEGDGQRTARATFVVTPAPAIKPHVFVTPGSGEPGDALTVIGAGWRPAGGPVSLFVSRADSEDPSRVPVAAALPDADGHFQVGASVPTQAAGGYVLIACQSCGSRTAALTATADLTIVGSFLAGWRLVALVVALLVAAGAVAGLVRRARRPRRPPRDHGRGPGPEPHLEPRPGPVAEVSSRSIDGLAAPALRLVPQPDRTTSVIDLQEPR